MNIQINISKIAQGILEINVPDAPEKTDPVQKPVDTPATPVTPKKEEPKPEVTKAFEGRSLITPQDVARAFRDLGKRYDNGRFSEELERAKIVKILPKSRRLMPGPEWKDSMGETRIMTKAMKKPFNKPIVFGFNPNHPAIRNILNNMYLTTSFASKKGTV